MAAANTHEPDLMQKKISDSTHAWRPREYSPIARHDGENSGLNTCKAASSEIAAPVKTMANQAADFLTCELPIVFLAAVLAPSSIRVPRIGKSLSVPVSIPLIALFLFSSAVPWLPKPRPTVRNSSPGLLAEWRATDP